MDKVLCVLLAMVLFCSCSKEDEDIQYEGYVIINNGEEIPIIDLYEQYGTDIVLSLKDGSYIYITPGETKDVLPTISAGYTHTIVNMNYGSGGAYIAQRGTMSVSKTSDGYKISGIVELDNFDIVNVRYGIK